MKKIFLFTTIIIFITFKTSFTYAQLNPLSIFTENNSCGIASDPTKNKCCNIQINLDNKNINDNLYSNIEQSQIDTMLKPPKEWYESLFNILINILDFEKTFIELTTSTNNVNPCLEGKPSTKNFNDPNCICQEYDYQTRILCDRYLNKPQDEKEHEQCIKCSEEKKGIWTAIGCVDGNFNKFITDFLLNIGVSLAGIISLFCIIYSAFKIQTSQGNSDKLKKAQEMLTSCIIGLVMIIFSVFILKLIGYSIFGF